MSYKYVFGILVLTIIDGVIKAAISDSRTKVCDGAERPGAAENPHDAHKFISIIYRGCTHIVNHLSLFNLKPGDDISFLSSIVEVGGSVFIGSNTVREIPLSNLRVIRGRKCGQWEGGNYSLVITYNFAPKGKHGYVNLRSLDTIERCNVYVNGNKGFCYLSTLKYDGLLADPVQQRISFKDKRRNCLETAECSPTCPLICGERYCHGPSPKMCSQASQYEGVCHRECTGGCTGGSDTECRACRNFQDGNKCVKSCPVSKFAHFTLCVDACPKRYLTSEGICVEHCPVNTYPKNGKCETCTGTVCDTVCWVQEKMNQLKARIPLIREKFADTPTTPRSLLLALKGCTIVDGDIQITAISNRIGEESIKEEDFQNLKSVRYINGFLYLLLEGYPNIKNLSFLSNLETLHTPTAKKGLEIYFGRGLQYLGLTKLKTVNAQKLYIIRNSQLCYLEKMCSRFGSSVDNYMIMWNNKNCGSKVCDKSCPTKNGCWGPSRQMCVQWSPYPVSSLSS